MMPYMSRAIECVFLQVVNREYKTTFIFLGNSICAIEITQ